jgi:hypothetical protein
MDLLIKIVALDLWLIVDMLKNPNELALAFVVMVILWERACIC